MKEGFWLTSSMGPVSVRVRPLFSGNDLIKFRKVRRAPQQAVADLLGVGRDTISRWEALGDEQLPPMAALALTSLRPDITAYRQEIGEEYVRRGRPIRV